MQLQGTISAEGLSNFLEIAMDRPLGWPTPSESGVRGFASLLKNYKSKRSFLSWHFARNREKGQGKTQAKSSSPPTPASSRHYPSNDQTAPAPAGEEPQPNARRARGTEPGPPPARARLERVLGPGSAPRRSLCTLGFGLGHFLGFPGPPGRSNREPDRLRGPSLVRRIHGCTPTPIFSSSPRPRAPPHTQPSIRAIKVVGCPRKRRRVTQVAARTRGSVVVPPQ